MLKRIVVTIAASAFLWWVVPVQADHHRGRDDIWDLMDPSWWADEIFDNNDKYDDWWYYRHHQYSPYWRGPYGWHPPLIIIQEPTETNNQNPEPERPE
jgi:hypothetical protein